MNNNKLYQEFQNPSAQYRGKPFWSWNGKLEKEELLRQVHVMKEMGFGGYFMHSRTGLETEYLGEEWFDLINACADEGEKLGMEAWLYDEDRWPSGTAGGMVTMEPKYRMKYLHLDVIKGSEMLWAEDVIAAFTCTLDGLELFDYKAIYKDSEPGTYRDLTVLKFTVVEMEKNTFYNGYTYADTLNREATERFIELTHEKYREQCGDRLGRSVRGIFTDEPHRGQLMSSFGSSAGKTMIVPEWSVPWTYNLFDSFRECFGYDVEKHLPELFLWYKGKKISEVKWHYVDVLQRLFLENFVRPINEWCLENNIILTGHTLQEDSLAAQTAVVGSMMRVYENMGYPGVDVLTEGNQNYWLVKQLSSAARQTGQKWLLSELYGCTGWQFSFESHKNVGDWQALLGINLRCHHLSWYTMQGEAKRDFPASILHQSAWWKDYKYVEAYFSRIAVIMGQGEPCCDTLVLNPVESVWCQIHPGWCNRLNAEAPEIKKLEELYRSLFHWLMGAHIDFDYGDEEMMSRLYCIQKDGNGIPILKIGKASYRQVVVSGMVTMRSTTLKILEEFMNAGGRVVFAGELPSHVDAVESRAVTEKAVKAVKIPFERDELVTACREYGGKIVEITGGNRNDIHEIFIQTRKDSSNTYVFMLNMNRKEPLKGVKIRLNRQGFVEEWNCATGERYALGGSEAADFEYTADFSAGGERLFVITGQKDETLGPKHRYEKKESHTLKGVFDYELDEPNICVLDMASFQINEGEFQPEEEILKIDWKIRDNLGLDYRSGRMIQPWFAKKTGFEIKGKVVLRFEFFIDTIPEAGIELAMERPENFSLSLNGRAVDTAEQKGWWTDVAFRRIPLDTGLLSKGSNIIELAADFHQGIDLEALYLLGGFGVQLEGSKKTIVDLPDKLKAGDLVSQGLPFYSGGITYILDVNYKAGKDEAVFLTLDGFGGAFVKARCQGGSTRMIAWQPYEADITEGLRQGSKISLELVLTRRNTFGPLHQVPLYASSYGPRNFVTEGDGFSNDYMLIPAGLLSSPRLCIKSRLKD